MTSLWQSFRVFPSSEHFSVYSVYYFSRGTQSWKYIFQYTSSESAQVEFHVRQISMINSRGGYELADFRQRRNIYSLSWKQFQIISFSELKNRVICFHYAPTIICKFSTRLTSNINLLIGSDRKGILKHRFIQCNIQQGSNKGDMIKSSWKLQVGFTKCVEQLTQSSSHIENEM